MNSQHRTRALFSLFILLTIFTHAFAQQKGRRNQARPVDDKAAQRRNVALNLLLETAENARAFKDLAYRARLQALAADALWPYDETRARALFRRAWEAATASDREEQRREEEEAGVFSNPDEVTWTDARDEIVSKVAARDEKLADGFMREMVAERERAESRRENKAARRTPWRELSPLGARRLALAYELLNKGDYMRAARVAEPLINEGVSGDLVAFLVRLSDPIPTQGGGGVILYSLADTLYIRLVEKTLADPDADANDVLLLSSFLISPDLLMVVDEKGGLQFRSVPQALADRRRYTPGGADNRVFYTLVVKVLLGRGPVSQRALNPLQDRIARYITIGRVLPYLEREGPEFAQYVPVMRSQLSSLSSEMEASRRDTLNSQFELTSMNSKNKRDPLAPELEQLSRASDKGERDRISFEVARRAARAKLWDRAQRAAYGIEDGSLRRAALAYIVVQQIADIARAYKEDKENDFESAARFVRRADAPPFASAWGLAQAAVIASRKKDAEATNALLTEAESYAARADKDSRQRVAAYLVITSAAAEVKAERAWDFLSELVRAANSTPDYTGDESRLPTSADTLEDSTLQDELTIESESFRLAPVFATMARLNFDKALAQAEALTGEIPRAYARLATARAELEKK
jgi:hypothetical protein